MILLDGRACTSDSCKTFPCTSDYRGKDAMLRKLLIGCVSFALVAVGAAPAIAAESTIRPVRSCAELVREFAVPDARTQVTSAAVVPASGTTPEFCNVQGKIEPNVGFQLKLPTQTYRGRYVQYGCGGFCGFISDPAFPQCGPAFGDAAVAATDDGHQWSNMDPFDTTWAKNDQKARDDLFFRAPHVLSKVSKHIIGSLIYQRQDFADAMAILAHGGIDRRHHITATIPLRDIVSHGFLPLSEDKATHVKIQVYAHE